MRGAALFARTDGDANGRARVPLPDCLTRGTRRIALARARAAIHLLHIASRGRVATGAGGGLRLSRR
ncbi:hypothetical protein MILUP08_40695 [Micromonospora lupini str. Lupac 08]|uniref:Uncharacterized protein n=1 Tax=Micromonospora lupini str. Lupac 08 TaxID=1150864 RepID=I0KW37_9ACTN|nr:hypothetical protein MILUP08_40695 [Micromonospora lupini str. Lupac 08]